MHIKHKIIIGKKGSNNSITSNVNVLKNKRIKIKYNLSYGNLLTKINNGKNQIIKPIKLLWKTGSKIKKITVFNVAVSIFNLRFFIEDKGDNIVGKKINVYITNNFNEAINETTPIYNNY